MSGSREVAVTQFQYKADHKYRPGVRWSSVPFWHFGKQTLVHSRSGVIDEKLRWYFFESLSVEVTIIIVENRLSQVTEYTLQNWTFLICKWQMCDFSCIIHLFYPFNKISLNFKAYF